MKTIDLEEAFKSLDRMESYTTDEYVRLTIGFCRGFLMLHAKETEPFKELEIRVYNEEEIHEDCTVQILRNTVTGDTSIGWWENA